MNPMPNELPTIRLPVEPPQTTKLVAPLPGADNYLIGDELARGGMGSILQAEDSKLKRTVAIKVMLLDASASETARQRFLREAEVLALLSHPNIVPIYDIVWEDGLPLFYSMKLVKGRTLQAILADLRKGEAATLQQHSLASLLTIFRKVCDALAFAHSKGILHRDLKPDNIMVGEFGEVLVMDWGLAKLMGDSGESMVKNGTSGHSPLSSFNHSPLATLQGSVIGTPQYMSPEQALGQIDELDERSDIFSLGGILYAILTLRPPVEGKTLEEVLSKVTSAEITSPTDLQTLTTAVDKKPPREGQVLDAKLIRPLPHMPGGRVPSALSSVAMKALRRDKAWRFQTVDALSADIEAYQGGFATTAEEAGTLRQLTLLMLRHKAVALSLGVLLLVSVGFVFKVLASERKATRNAEIATANERRAEENAEQTRRALKTSQIALAEAAYRTADLTGMVRALDSVPEDLRDQRWDYLSVKRDASLGDFILPGFAEAKAVVAIPGRPGQFALANSAGVVAIVDVRSKAVLRRMMTPYTGALVLAVSQDATRLAITAEKAAEMTIYRTDDGGAEKTLPSPSKSVISLTFSPNGEQLAVLDQVADGSKDIIADSRAFLLDVRSGSVRWQFQGLFHKAIFSPDGSRLFMCSSRSRNLTVLGVEKGDLIRRTAEYVLCMAMSRDGGRIALGLYSGEVVIINVITGLETRRARLHLGGITHVTWTAGDHLLTIGNEAGYEAGRPVMRLWETQSFSARGTFFGLKEEAFRREFDFQPVSGHLLLLDSPPQLWHIPVDVEAARLSSENAEQGWSTCFLSDSLLLGRADYELQCFDVSNPRHPEMVNPRGPDGYVMSAAHPPSGIAALARRITGPPHSIKLYRNSDMKELREIPMPSWTMGMDFDLEGKRLLAFAAQGGSFVFDVATGKPLLRLPHKLESAVFVGTGNSIAAIVPQKPQSSHLPNVLILLDAMSGKVLKSRQHPARLRSLAASPDRKLIAIGGADQVIRVLDAETLEERIDFRAHDAEISALAFHPQLPQLASASSDGSVKLWDYQTARLQHSFLGFDGMPVMLAFSPNGRLLAVEAQEHTSRLFDLSGESPPAAVKPAIRAPFPVLDKNWLPLISALTEDDLIDEGNGWRRQGDSMLLSPDHGPAVLPLPVTLAGKSYEVEVTLRQLVERDVFHVVLPVGERMVGFDLDGAAFAGYYTGLVTVDGQWGKSLPGALHGKIVKDSEPHVLSLSVRLHDTAATITVTLDSRPLYAWSGAQSSLNAMPFWPCPPGRLAIGTISADWAVPTIKVRLLE